MWKVWPHQLVCGSGLTSWYSESGPTSWCGGSGLTSWCSESGPTSWCGESGPTSWCGEFGPTSWLVNLAPPVGVVDLASPVGVVNLAHTSWYGEFLEFLTKNDDKHVHAHRMQNQRVQILFQGERRWHTQPYPSPQGSPLPRLDSPLNHLKCQSVVCVHFPLCFNFRRPARDVERSVWASLISCRVVSLRMRSHVPRAAAIRA